MEAIRLHKVVERDGEIFLAGLPYKKGQNVEMILMISHSSMPGRPNITANQLIHSGLIGLWADREDIADSTVFARQLREQAQRR